MLGGCVQPPATEDEPTTDDPNAGLLRDFLDGKFDSAGHPLNARVTEAESLCPSAGAPHNGSIRLKDRACEGTLGGSEQNGDLVASVRLSASTAKSSPPPSSPRATSAAPTGSTSRSRGARSAHPSRSKSRPHRAR
jgi:hypothetical protein